MVLTDFFRYYRRATRSDMQSRWGSLLQVTVIDRERTNTVVKAAYAIVDVVNGDDVSLIVTYGDGSFASIHRSALAIEKGLADEFYLVVRND